MRSILSEWIFRYLFNGSGHLYNHVPPLWFVDGGVCFVQETSIELVIIGEDGIAQSVCEQPVFGTIKDIAILPWNEKFNARNPQVCYLVPMYWTPYKDISALEDLFIYFPFLKELSLCYWKHFSIVWVPFFTLLFCRCWVKTFWLLYLIRGSSHFSHFAMKCTGFSIFLLSSLWK